MNIKSEIFILKSLKLGKAYLTINEGTVEMQSLWIESIDEPTQLEKFRTYAKQTLTRLAVLESSLQSVGQLFFETKALNNEECQRILDLLHILSEPTQDLQKLLENTAMLPKAIVMLRYPLDVALSYMDKQMYELRLLLEQYISSKRCSGKRKRLLHAMRSKLEGIIQTFHDILQRIPVLLDQSHFQEHKQNMRQKPGITNSKLVIKFPTKMH